MCAGVNARLQHRTASTGHLPPSGRKDQADERRGRKRKEAGEKTERSLAAEQYEKGGRKGGLQKKMSSGKMSIETEGTGIMI